MSDQLPPPEPSSPQPPPFQEKPAPVYPAAWKTAGIGALIFIVSAALCFANPVFFLFGFIGAFVSLFIKGYRPIFLGYILCMGLVLLVLTVVCFINPPDFK